MLRNARRRVKRQRKFVYFLGASKRLIHAEKRDVVTYFADQKLRALSQAINDAVDRNGWRALVPRVRRTATQQQRVDDQARAATGFGAEKRVQEAESEIETVSASVPNDLESQLFDYEARIAALETP